MPKHQLFGINNKDFFLFYNIKSHMRKSRNVHIIVLEIVLEMKAHIMFLETVLEIKNRKRSHHVSEKTFFKNHVKINLMIQLNYQQIFIKKIKTTEKLKN